MLTDLTTRGIREVLEGRRTGARSMLLFTGPAVIASIAYMDPGNFATNIQAGAKYGYELLWVVLSANLIAMLVLFFLALQALVSVLLPGGHRWFGPSLGPQSVARVVSRTMDRYLATYRTELESDVADFREPMLVLQKANAVDEATT